MRFTFTERNEKKEKKSRKSLNDIKLHFQNHQSLFHVIIVFSKTISE